MHTDMERSHMLKWFRISRVRFWLYLAGPFLIGNGANFDFFSLYMFFYFLIPANVMLYGINDIFDKQTDSLSIKKIDKESKISSEEDLIYTFMVSIIAILLALPIYFTQSLTIKILLTFFLFLSVFYSMPPLRFKGRAIIDHISNILYIIPGIVAFVYWNNTLPPYHIVVAASFWSFAMHIFSAIPDIEVDKSANITTTATILGPKISIILCGFYYFITGILTMGHLLIFSLSMVYVLIMFFAFLQRNSQKNLLDIYWKFPLLNAIIGFIIYLYRVWS